MTSTAVAPYRRQGYERRAALAEERRKEALNAAAAKKAKESRQSDRELERTRRRAPWSCAADAGPAARYTHSAASTQQCMSCYGEHRPYKNGEMAPLG